MLATLFTSFSVLNWCSLADRTEERVLPVPVSFILDEFPNIGVVPGFKKKLATARSRQIGMSILFQNIPQLQNRYPDNQWEEILGGCDFSIFLGCNDMTTATYYSDRTGEVTVSVASVRKNFYTIRATDYVPEYSESRSLGKRQLLLPDEVLRYPLNQGILIIRGHNVLRFPEDGLYGTCGCEAVTNGKGGGAYPKVVSKVGRDAEAGKSVSRPGVRKQFGAQP